MERHACTDGGFFGGWKKQSIGAKVIEADWCTTDCDEHRAKATSPEQLAGENVMALQPGIVGFASTAVDMPERDGRARALRKAGSIAMMRVIPPPVHRLFAPNPDESAIAGRLHHQPRTVRRDHPLAAFESADQHELIDETNSKSRRRNPVLR